MGCLRLEREAGWYCGFVIAANSTGSCHVVGPCHHGMARPQVADGGTASFMEGSCE